MRYPPRPVSAPESRGRPEQHTLPLVQSDGTLHSLETPVHCPRATHEAEKLVSEPVVQQVWPEGQVPVEVPFVKVCRAPQVAVIPGIPPSGWGVLPEPLLLPLLAPASAPGPLLDGEELHAPAKPRARAPRSQSRWDVPEVWPVSICEQ
jgi:hypothetical protein